MAKANATELQQLYIAYFGRAADPTGLEYWTGQETTTKAFAASMYAQPEFKSVYGSLSTEAQVNQIYQNLFDRDADTAGLLYWTNQIKSGALELASIANDLIYAANNNSGSADDKKALDNKTAAATAYTAEVKKTTAGILAYAAASTDPFVAGSNIEAAKSFFDGIDKDTTHTEAQVIASVSTIKTNGVQTTGTYTLTSNAPSLTEGDTGTKTLAFTLSLDKAATADTAVNYETLSTGSATPGDDFVATSGQVTFAKGQKTATVNVTINNDTDYESEGVAETVDIKFSSTSLTADVTATGSITENDSAPVASTPTTYTLTSDSPSITEGDTETKTLAFTLSLDKAATSATTINYETLTTGSATPGDDFVAASGTVSFAEGQKTATVNITVNNDTDYESEGVAETVEIKFSGSSLTADVTASGSIKENETDPDLVAKSLTLTTGVDTLTGKKGNDTFDGSTAGSMDTSDTIEGGDGTDTLSFTIAGESIRPTIKNVEKINFTATADTLNIDTRSITGVTEFTNESSVGASAINNLATIPTVTINSASSAADQTINFLDATLSGTSDELTINLNNFGGSSDIIVTDAGGTTNKLETIIFNATSLPSTVTDLRTDDGTDADVGTTTIKATGDELLTISTALDTSITTVDSTGSTGGLVATGANTTGMTMKGGSGPDSFTSTSGADTLEGGAGKDTLVPSTGIDTVKGGAGNDTIKLAANDLTEKDTIDGGAGTDTIEYTTDEVHADADFTLVSNLEVITATANKNITAVLGPLSAAAGLNSIVLADTEAIDSITINKDFTNDLSVTLVADGTANSGNYNKVVANADYAKTLSVTGKVSDMDDGDGVSTAADANVYTTITGGKGTSDSLTLKIDESDDAVLSHVSKIETIKFADGDTDNNHTSTITLANGNATYTSATDYETLTVDLTAIGADGDTANADASSEADAKIIIKGGAGINTITVSGSANFGDTITAGAGNDVISFATANLTKADSIDGGDGTDTIQSADNAEVVDADFTLVTNVETLSGGATSDLDATIDTLAAAAGINTVTFLHTGDVGDALTVKAGFTNDLTVNLDDNANDDINTVDASLYVGSNLVVKTTSTNIEDSTTFSPITGSANLNDIYEISVDNASTSNKQEKVLNFETFKIVDGETGTDRAFTFTLAEENVSYTNSTTYETVTIDATAIGADGDTITIDASDENNGKVIIKGGAGVNTITISQSANFGDTITAGAGNDTISLAAAADLTKADSIDGGTGDDTISLAGTGTLVDADFTGVTNFKTITAAANIEFTGLTLGAEAAEAGISVVTLASTDAAAETVTVGSGFTNDLTINLDADAAANTITATGYTKNLTVKGLGTDLDGIASTLTGGSGTDNLQITGTGDALTMLLTSVTKFETITIKDDTDATADAMTLTTVEGNIADGETMTIDTTDLSVDTAIVSFLADTDGNNVFKGGATVDTVTGSASDLGDNFSGGAGDDIFKFATANLTLLDTVDGGTGDDTISITDAATVVDADFTNVTNIKTIKGASTLDITLDTLAQAAGITTLTTTSGSTGKYTINSGYTNAISIALGATTATDTIDASASTATVTITGDVDLIASTDTLKGGSGGSDELKLSLDGNTDSLNGTKLGGVTGFEKVTITNDDALSFTTPEGMVADSETLTFNADKITTQVLTFNGSAENDGKFVISAAGAGGHIITLGNSSDTYTSSSTGVDSVTATAGNNTISTGDGDDAITGGTGADNIKGQNGADTFTFATANLDSNDTIDGGAGTDIIELSNDATVIDADFTNITNTETLTSSANSNLTATVGTNAASSGLATVTFADITGNDSLTISSGFTQDLTVNFDSDASNANSVVATNYTKSLTVKASDENLDTTASTITGGTGSDTLEVAVGNTDTLLLGSVTNIETILLKADGIGTDVTTITTADTLVADGKSITIDGRNLDDGTTDAKLVFSAAAEADGTVTVLLDGSAAHEVTLGAKNDTLTDTGSGALIVTATGGDNTIKLGTGGATITAGTGTDTITVGTGADTVKWSTAAGSIGDSITDFVSGTDKLHFTIDLSGKAQPVTVNAVRTGAGKAGVTAAESTMTGKYGEFVYDTTNSKLVMDITGDGTISGADHTIGINAATTAANTIAVGDVSFTITGTAGADIITTGGGADTISGGAGLDTITSGAGNDIINASAGADVIVAGAGDDNITTGTGSQTVTGGTGADTYTLGTGANIIKFTTKSDGGTLHTLTDVSDSTDDFDATPGTDCDVLDNTWAVGSDFFDFSGDLKSALTAASEDLSNGTGTDCDPADANAAGVVIIAPADGKLSGTANFGDVTAIKLAFDGHTKGLVDGDNIVFGVENTDGTKTAFYYLENTTGNDAIDATDKLALLAVVTDATITATEITFS